MNNGKEHTEVTIVRDQQDNRFYWTNGFHRNYW